MTKAHTDYEVFERSSVEHRRLLREEELILDVTEALSEVLEKEGVKRAELAERLGKTKGFVSQILAGGRNLTLRTIADVADALGYRVRIAFSCPNDRCLSQGAPAARKKGITMVMKLSDYFEAFRQAIEPDPRRKAQAQAADDPVRAHLETHESFAARHVSTFLYGSYRRNTAAGDIKDVDLVVVTNYTTDDDPADVLSELRDALAELYDEPDLADQRRSIRVDRPLPDVPGSTLTLDVIPAIYQGKPDGPLWVPDREKKLWVPSHPRGHIQYVSNLNARSYQGNMFVRLVKMMKWWWKYQFEQKRGNTATYKRKPKGFWIEVMTGQYVDLSRESYPELIVSLMGETFGAFKSFRTDGRIPQLQDPGLQGQTIQTSTTKEEFAFFLDTLEESLAWGKEAINAPTEEKAAEWWQKVFGDRFPLAQDSKKSQSLLSPAAAPSGLNFPNRPVTPRKPGGFASMDIWFLSDLQRLSRERTAVAQLEASADWLVGTSWFLEGGLLCLDAIIRAHGHDYQVRMVYPALFPSVPPTVYPRNAEIRWSDHQYGDSNGSLCLEWGPDNWHPDVTGAQMLESAYKLLNIENPFGRGRAAEAFVAPSRHHLSIGQELRASYGRFYIGDALVAYLAVLPDQAAGIFRFSTHLRAASGLAMIHEVQPGGEPTAQVDSSIPESLQGRKDSAALQSGVFFKTRLEPEIISQAHGVKELEDVLRSTGHETALFAEDGNLNAMQRDQHPFGVLVLDRFNDPHCFILLNEQELLPLARARSDAPTTASRTPENLKGLRGKSVGIVGLGSVGSKVALSLGRMGVRIFFLDDHDVFFPENTVRGELDWSNIGEHKVDSVRERLLRIHADVRVDISRLHLTGQESTAAVSGVLNALGRCDLLIDATANPGVFNLMAAVATAAQKPLVWMEVYAGGKGGMIARSRPGRDPDPQTMRAAYNQYCLEHPAPEYPTTDDYTTEDAEGQVLTASDADVAIIASHTARFAVDTVLGCDPSIYPYSMYLIGLARWWVFDAPFHTIPIATDHFLRPATGRKDLTEADAENIEFINDLLRKSDAIASSS